MSGIVTPSFKNDTINNLINEIGYTSNVYFVGFGRQESWDDELAPPAPNNSVQSYIYQTYDSLLFGKRVSAEDVVPVIRKVVWTLNTVYDYFDHKDGSLLDKDFYVVNRYGRVYKCLFNNYGSESTVEPNETVVKTHFATADGYIWKYMYSITSRNSNKFTSNDYMPVVPNEDVTLNAERGALHVIVVSNTGTGYISTSGLVQDVISDSITSSTIKISNTDSSGSTGAYINSRLYISSGDGVGTLGKVTDYVVNSSGKFITSDADLGALSTSSFYEIAPFVKIVGNGDDAQAVATVNSTTTGVSAITVVSRGENYSQATVTISANVEYGSGATAYSIISPNGGHGADVAEELGVSTIGLSIDTQPSDQFPDWANYRQVCLLRNPLATSNNDVFTEGTFFQSQNIGINNFTDLFPPGEIVTGFNSGATATVLSMSTTEVSLSNIQGIFQLGETMTGYNTGLTCTVSAINNQDLVPYSGKIMYVNNFTAVSREGATSERVRIYIKI